MKISPYTPVAANQSVSNQTASANKTAAQSFKEFMEKSPQEMIFESFLKKNSLTKEQFEALSFEQKQEVLQDFEEEMKRKVGLVGSGV